MTQNVLYILFLLLIHIYSTSCPRMVSESSTEPTTLVTQTSIYEEILLAASGGNSSAMALTVAKGDQQLTSSSLVAAQQDICKMCDCQQKETVTCNLKNHPKNTVVFDRNWVVPKNVLKLIIITNEKNVSLEAGFFNKNTINSLIVMGNNSAEEQVEIGTKALNGNNGAYPEIRLHNLNTVIVHSKIGAGSIKLNVTDVKKLIIQKDAFENAKINCHFTNIKNLQLAENAFISSKFNLRIKSSYMANLYRFGGSPHVMHIAKSNIGTIHNGTFDMYNINSIKLKDTNIGTIKAGAFTDKLNGNLSITGGSISSIETEAIYGSGIKELILNNNSIENMHERAIDATAINVTMANNNIKDMGKNALQVKDWSYVVVNNNRFGIFVGISVEQTASSKCCQFENNSIAQPRNGFLNLNSLCEVHNIAIDAPCTCDSSWLSAQNKHDYHTEIYCKLDQQLHDGFNASNISFAKFLEEVCDKLQEAEKASFPTLVFAIVAAVVVIMLICIWLFFKRPMSVNQLLLLVKSRNCPEQAKGPTEEIPLTEHRKAPSTFRDRFATR